MGQLSQADASSFRNELVTYFTGLKSDVRENFNEMDFENADKRTQMGVYISNMESKFDDLIRDLNNLSFE